MAKSKFLQELEGKDAQMDMTPVIDISFLLIVFFICLPFKALEAKLAAYLPTDKGINPTNEKPPDDIKVKVHIVVSGQDQRPWGPGKPLQQGAADPRPTVSMPTKVRFKVNDRLTDDIETVYNWIEEAKKQAEANKTSEQKVLGEIQAGHRIPVKFVVAVLNKFAQAKLEKVDFYGTSLPTPDLRKEKALPYPTSDYVGVEGG